MRIFGLGNHDIDTSLLSIEMIWAGIEVPEIKKQVAVDIPKSFGELVDGRNFKYWVPLEKMKKFSNICTKKLLEDKKLVSYLKKRTHQISGDIRKFGEMYHNKVDDMSDEKMVKIIQKIRDLQFNGMSYGTVVVFADWQGQISNKIMEIIKKRKNLRYLIHIYSNILASPKKKNLTEQAKDKIKKSKNDKEMLKKFFWLEQGYIGRGLTKDMLYDIKKHISKNDDNISIEKLKRELKLNNKEWNVFKTSQDIIEIKSVRADSRQFAYVVLNKIIDRIAYERNVKTEYLETLFYYELIDFIKGNIKIPDDIKKRWDHAVIIPKKKKRYDILLGKDAKDHLNRNLLRTELKDTNEIKGMVAQPGKTKGKVCLVFTQQHNNKIKEGDVIVSIATSPQLLPAMKRAAAFVTDVGGITSHAAIVAREMKKPCIVGTKYGTELLKDGDLVEVDADKGVVKILKRK